MSLHLRVFDLATVKVQYLWRPSKGAQLVISANKNTR
jgi:hypothetical protein